MIDAIYELLAKFGYTHPLHPAIQEITTGAVALAFIFASIAALFKRLSLAQCARNCIIAGLILIFPTALLGYLDWQHYYNGAMLDDILIKLITAGILLLVMLASVLLGRKGRAGSKVVLVTYTLALFAVVVLGYYGAELVFGGKTEVVAPEYQAGAKIFRVNCNACHPSGGNIVNPKLSVLGAPQLIDFKSFLAYLRAPKPPPGFPPLMPPVPPTKLSDQQVQQLFEYITKSLEHPRRKAQAP